MRESANAVTIQVYVGLIPSLLLAVWTSRKANKTSVLECDMKSRM